MIKFSKLIVSSALMSLAMATTSVLAASFYVRAGAAGANNGSDWSNAWSQPSSIDYSKVNPGDSIYIAAGTYGAFAITKSGTAGNPITFKRATPGEHGTSTGWSDGYDGRVVVDGGGGLFAIGIGEGGSYVGQNYITIDGATRYGIWLRNAMYGVRAGREPGANNLTIRYVEAGDSGAYKLGEDGIQGQGDNLVVENSYIHDNDNISTHGDGVQWFRGTNLVFRYNVFKNNGQAFMLTVEAWGSYVNDLSIYYNVFYNRGGSHYNGISKQMCPQSGYTWKIYNNTFDLEANSNTGYDSLLSGAGTCSQMDFKNNAVVYSNAASLGGMTHSHNAFDNSGEYLAYNIPGSEVGRVVATDLGFVDITNANYRPVSGSPLIGKGTNLGLTRDFDGKAVSSSPTIGAFEGGSGSAVVSLSPPSGLTVK
jgi:hypothetical protein